MKNKLQILRKEALQRNPNFEGCLDKKIIKQIIKSDKGLDDFSDSTNLEILVSLNYRLNRFQEIKLSEFGMDSSETNLEFVYCYYVELLYIRGYSYVQIENMITRIKKLLIVQPELSIMGLDF